MHMTSFSSRFPGLAEEETRIVTVLEGGPVPRGDYVFMEFYCADPKCDCRNVILSVVDLSGRRFATINHALDPDRSEKRGIPGTSLDVLNAQSEHAEAFLDLFLDKVLDEAYSERLERHYQMMKKPAARAEEPRKKPFKIPRPRALEKLMAGVSRALRGKDFESNEEMTRHIQDLQASGELDAMTPESALDEAQDLVYEAFDEDDPKKRSRFARRALKICPDCADAYNLLAEEAAQTPEEARDLYQKAVEAGERALGKGFFKENAGRFWGHIGARPYMRARLGLAHSLWKLDEREAALEHYHELLRLNPNDNQGVRYVLLAGLGTQGRFDELDRLLTREEYKDDGGLQWLMMKALAAFRREGPTAKAEAPLRGAFEDNEHLVKFLRGEKRMPTRLPGMITVGGEDEAASCLAHVMPAWERVEGALDWLAVELQKRLHKAPLPRARRNDPCPCGSGKKYKKCCGR